MSQKIKVNSEKAKHTKVRKSNKILWSLIAIFSAAILGWIIILASGGNPIDYYWGAISGNFTSVTAFGNFLGTLSWMLPIGLSLLIAFRVKLFNIGASGQMMLGGICGYLFATFATWGRGGVIFSILIPMLAGMSLALLIGWLKTRFNINEVISSIMLNWSVFYLYKYLTNATYNPWLFSSSNTLPINPDNSLRLTGLSEAMPNSTVNMMIFIVFVLLIILAFMYARTKWGYKQNVLGNSEKAATYVGFKRKREILKTMSLSGAFAGLAGAAFYLGVNQNLPLIGSNIPSQGFSGITIALIAFNNPIGVFFSSMFVGALYNARTMISVNVNPHITDLVLGLIVWSIAITNFFIIYRPQDKFFMWMDGRKEKLFANRSHGLEFLIKRKMEEEHE